VLSLVVVLPWVADTYGRRWVYIGAFTAFMIIAALLLTMTDVIALYILLFCAGATIGGRTIVANNFFLEYFESKLKDPAIFIRVISGSLLIIIYTAWLQFGTRNYRIVAWVSFALGLIPLVFVLLSVPESPAWQEERGTEEDYRNARRTLTYVARINGVEKVDGRKYKHFRFQSEQKMLDAAAAGSVKESEHIEEDEEPLVEDDVAESNNDSLNE
jgi:MFS family permease